MSKQSLNTLKSWFVTKAKPLAVQFWHWMDSYWHKDELIPAASIDGLQTLLDGKMDVKAGVDPEQVGVYDPAKNYVFDALVAEYVSFANANSADPQFQTEKFYRLKENAPAGENPETHPAHWAYQGTVIGEITIDDVVGLREELDQLSIREIVRTIVMDSNDIDLSSGEDFEKTCASLQAFTISNEIIKKPFRLILTGGSLATTLFTGYIEYWINDSSKSDYDNTITNYLWCEIRESGKIYLFRGQ